MPSALDTALNQYYLALTNADAQVTGQLATAYEDIIGSLETKIQDFIGDPQGLQRLFDLYTQATDAWELYNTTVAKRIAIAQDKAIAIGADLSGNSLRGTLGAGPARFDRTWNTLPRDAITETVGMLTDGAPLKRLTDEMAGSMASALRQELITGQALGRNPQDVARTWGQLFAADKRRLETIARTEMLRAAREGSRRSMLANKDLIKGWQWFAARDRRTCAVCFAMHGTMFELGVKMATHPRCRCAMVPVTPSWAELGYPDIPNPVNRGFAESSESLLRADPTLCRLALGKGGCKGFQEGLFGLSDFVQDTYSPRWGYGRTVKPLSRLVKPYQARLLTQGVTPPDLLSRTASTIPNPPGHYGTYRTPIGPKTQENLVSLLDEMLQKEEIWKADYAGLRETIVGQTRWNDAFYDDYLKRIDTLRTQKLAV